MTGKIMPLRERDISTVQAAADAFLYSPRYANPNTRRSFRRQACWLTGCRPGSAPARYPSQRSTGRCPAAIRMLMPEARSRRLRSKGCALLSAMPARTAAVAVGRTSPPPCRIGPGKFWGELVGADRKP
jgi:hypothetical protein